MAHFLALLISLLLVLLTDGERIQQASASSVSLNDHIRRVHAAKRKVVVQEETSKPAVSEAETAGSKIGDTLVENSEATEKSAEVTEVEAEEEHVKDETVQEEPIEGGEKAEHEEAAEAGEKEEHEGVAEGGEKAEHEKAEEGGEGAEHGEGELPGCSEEDKLEEEEEERIESEMNGLIVIGFLCMLGMFVCGFLLEHFDIMLIPEAGAGILIGVIVSAVLAHVNPEMEHMARFDTEFFFIYLLPPIIFEAGYNMKRQPFFRNIGAICAYAFIGTTVSTFAVGGMVYYAGQLGLCHPIGGLAALVFGALISATDPVTVLAVFQKLKADVDLYSLVFGESVMNDAVAIVLYRTLVAFKCTPVDGAGIAGAFASFATIFVVSTVIGILVGAASSLLFRFCNMREHDHFFFLEMCILATFPYVAFMLAEGLRLSGIVAILFCGITMSHYTYSILSDDAADTSRKLFKIIAQLAESFVFIYLGMAAFTFQNAFSQYGIVIISFLACLIARTLNIVPCSLLINVGRKSEKRIGPKQQFVMWFSGLRGAVAFVIAVTSWSNRDFPQVSMPEYPHITDGDCILTATLCIAVITVFLMGGPVGILLNKFDLREKEAPEEHAAYDGSTPGLMGRGQSEPMAAEGAIYYDRKYLKPFLTGAEWTGN